MKSVFAATTGALPAAAPSLPDSQQAPISDDPANQSIVKPDTGKPLWLSIHLPDLSRIVLDSVEGIPFVVVESIKGRHVIHSGCLLAETEGIVEGMSLNAARALCKNLQVSARDLNKEREFLQKQAEQFVDFTPTVSVELPNQILLEVSRSLRFFGGFEALLSQVKKRLPTAATLCCAPTASAAGLLAHCEQNKIVTRLQDLPSMLADIELEKLMLPVKTHDGLHKCGLRTLRDLWRLPRTDLARRFGTDLIDQLDRLQGKQNDPRYRIEQRLRFAKRQTLPTETDNTDLLVQAAERLLHKAANFLRKHGAATEAMRFLLWHRRNWHHDATTTAVDICCQQADRLPARFLPQLIERLQGMRLQQPVEAVSLHIDNPVIWQRQSEDLFDRRDRSEPDWPQLLEILQSKLGAQMVYQLDSVADHCPEHAWRQLSIVKRHQDKNQPDLPEQHRPLWLLPSPLEISEPTVEYRLISDVERIKGGWWRQPIHRDYHVGESRSGSWHWLYRDLNTRPARWYQHGIFA